MHPEQDSGVLRSPNVAQPSELTDIGGNFVLRISDESGHKEFSVPDPEELPRSIPLTNSELHVLQFIQNNVEPSPVQLSASGDGDASGSDHYCLGAAMNPSTVIKFLENISRTLDINRTNSKRMYRFHEREPKISRSPSNLRKKRLKRALRAGNPFTTGTWQCCSRYQCFKQTGPDRCYEAYTAVNSMNPKQAKRHLISMYDQCDNVFRMGGQIVCSRFLAKCLGFSNDVQCSIKSTPKARGSAIAHQRPREVKRKTKRVFIVLFIKRLAQIFGDAMPHKEQITLPVFNRKALWKECQVAWKDSGRHCEDLKISQNYFYRVWRTFASFVNVRKNHDFQVCSRCELLRAEMSKHLQDEDTLLTLIEQHAVHLKFIEREHSAYECRQKLEEQNPNIVRSLLMEPTKRTMGYHILHLAQKAT